MGKPVACYIREADREHVPAALYDALPIVRVTPTTIESDLEAAIRQRDQWPSWGRASREFALRWHHPRRIAAALLEVYKDPTAALTL